MKLESTGSVNFRRCLTRMPSGGRVFWASSIPITSHSGFHRGQVFHVAVRTTASASAAKKTSINPIQPDHVIHARHTGQSLVVMRFADGFEGTWNFKKLEIDTSSWRMPTIRASDTGDSIEVENQDGDYVYLDASSLRMLVDPNYADLIESKIASLLIPSERLERIAEKHQPPQQWYDAVEHQ